MSDMPNEIWMDEDGIWSTDELDDEPTIKTAKYIRADIAEARIAKLEEVLRWYGDKANYEEIERHECDYPVLFDEGQRAREVLKDE